MVFSFYQTPSKSVDETLKEHFKGIKVKACNGEMDFNHLFIVDGQTMKGLNPMLFEYFPMDEGFFMKNHPNVPSELISELYRQYRSLTGGESEKPEDKSQKFSF